MNTDDLLKAIAALEAYAAGMGMTTEQARQAAAVLRHIAGLPKAIFGSGLLAIASDPAIVQWNK